MSQLHSHTSPASAPGEQVPGRRLDLILLAATIFLSAYLLFLVQPLMGRYVLPWFGGGAGVWTTCMLFFQMVLLVGYAYAHLLVQLPGIRRQVAVHVSLLALSLLTLPVIPDLAWRPTGTEAPLGHILLLLATHVGGPFAVLAATTPLLGSWYRQAFPVGSPYRLYALSNAGSLLALLAYPFLIEPSLALHTQGIGWSWAYVIFAAACALTGWRLVLGASAQPSTSTAALTTSSELPDAGPDGPAGWKAFLLWIALAATGSVMLLATTSQISQEVSVVPMLWILPLAIYLLTFILCFESDGWYDRRVFAPLLVCAVAAVIFALSVSPLPSYTTQLVIYAATQFVCCMCCHGELARLRPNAQHLTRFYLGLSVGGALGGLFTAMLAPQIFSDFWEYHLALFATVGFVAVAVVRAHRCRLPAQVPQLSLRRLWVPACALLISVAVAVPMVLNANKWNGKAIEISRNFFGVIRVVEARAPSGPFREMYNGSTSHGTQLLSPELRQVPTAYYGVRSGLGFALRQLRQLRQADSAGVNTLRIGAVGLGAGTIAAMAQAGDYLRFYEINPQVERLARSHFSYLSDSPAEIDVVLGDARVALSREAERDDLQGFDILILDAFNDDSVPIHLLTEEAYQLYRRHLKPGGVLAFHTSNRHLALSPNVRKLAEDYGDSAVSIQSVDEGWFSVNAADWVLTTRNQAFLSADALAVEATPWAPWERVTQAWTDDFYSLWDALRQRRSSATNKWQTTPNAGLFVYDVAQLIDEPEEDRIRDLSRALYWQSKPPIPLFVITAKTLQRPDGSVPLAGTAVSELRQSLGLHTYDLQFEIMIFIVREQKLIEVHVGQSWPPRLRSQLENTLQQTMTVSLRKRGLSRTLLLMANKVDDVVRDLRPNELLKGKHRAAAD
jgi:SAM-dependent methyltransferase